MKTDQDLAPSDRTERAEKEKKTYPHNSALRGQLLAMREAGWSNNKIAGKIGMSTSVVSQYLDDAGCIYPADVSNFERKAADFVRNESRRRASGVETIECDSSKEISQAFEYARKTNDIAVIIADSGRGKSRGIEPYVAANQTCCLFNTRAWHKHETALRKFFFDCAPKGDWDKQTNWMDYAVSKLRSTDRFFIFDDAHKLPFRSLQLIVDFHDETQCPVALVGTSRLLDLIDKDPQISSREGIEWTVINGNADEMIKHLIKSLIPSVNGDYDELASLCEQVAANAGHFRAVHKQLKLAVEMRETSKVFKSWPAAFRGAHSKMHRDYQLS